MKEILHEINRLRPLFSRREKLKYVLLLGLMLLGALFDVIGIGAVPAFVAALAAPEQLMQYPQVANILNSLGLQPGRELLLWGSAVLFLIFLFKNAYLTWMYHFQFKLVEYHRVSLADRLFTAYMLAPYTFIMSRNTAELMRNVQTETMEIIRGIILPVLGAVMGVVMTLFTVTLLVLVTPWVALVGLLFIGGGSALFFRVVRSRLRTYGLTSKFERKESLQAINQGLGAIVDARVLGREEAFIASFRNSLTNFAYVDRLRQVINRASPYLLETISIAGLLVIILTLVLSGLSAAAMIPTLALFGAATMRLRQTIAQIVNGAAQVQYSLPAIGNVIDDLGWLEKQQQKLARQKNVPSITFEQAIELEHVSFAYPNSDIPALQDISLKIKKGESVAFVGATGSGKSTLVNLILGLLEPSEGLIKVDGQNIHANLRGWLGHVGYIPQSIFLVDDSIKKNIAFGLSEQEIAEGQLWEAIRAAQLEDFVNSLPDGVDTIVGERGIRLSGGQRQRIGLARALYHKPEVLVMDEATSALDNQTESLVMEALENVKFDRTLIMIAHRLSTVQKCDRLYFLEKGAIIANGNYSDLSKRHEAFRALANLA